MENLTKGSDRKLNRSNEKKKNKFTEKLKKICQPHEDMLIKLTIKKYFKKEERKGFIFPELLPKLKPS